MEPNEKESESPPQCPERSLSERLNTWVQTFGIIVGSIIVFIWGVFSFGYEKFWLPRSAPVNVTLNLSLKKGGIADNQQNMNQKPLVAIEMKVTAKNPSSRTVHLLPSAFIVWGHNVARRDIDMDNFIKEICKISISSLKTCNYNGFHFTRVKSSMIAIGRLLEDEFLRPNELVENCFTFFLPQGGYDMLQANIVIPCAKDKSGLNLNWVYNKDRDCLDDEISYQPKPIFWLFRRNAKEYKLKKDKVGGYSQEDYDLLNYLEYQEAKSMSMISLWEEPKIDASKPIKTKLD